MNDDIENIQPIDSFSTVYKLLAWTGFYKPLNNPTSGYKRVLHQIYRHLACLIIVIYTIQHIIYIAQKRHEYDNVLRGLIILIPMLNLVMKVGMIIYQTSRIDGLNNFLKEDITFRASDKEGQSILQKNNKEMQRLCTIMNYLVSVDEFIMISSCIVRRYNDPEHHVPSYLPFETDTWAKFILSVFLELGFIWWVGYGHIGIDVLISTYYAHAQTQIKVIKQQLEHFVGKEETRGSLKSYFQFKDLIDENVGKRFVLIVRRYEKLIWFKNEVDSIFNIAITFQFFTSTTCNCFLIYNMSVVSVTSMLFLFSVIFFFTILSQVFLYCYFGNLLEFESHSINDSLYSCDWPSLSPPFRRQMLIAMIRWSQPIQPTFCNIIPLSLNSFVTIVKSTYTLYTVLVSTNTKDA